MLIKHEGEDYIAGIVSFPNDPAKINIYPLDRVLALNPQTEQDKAIAALHPVKEIVGHPYFDVADEGASVTVTPQKRRFVERSVNSGHYVILVRANDGGGMRVTRTSWDKLGLTEAQLAWLQLYCQFTNDYFPELVAKLAAQAQPEATPEPKRAPEKKPKMKRKDIRQTDRRRAVESYVQP
jgi:hypothetical protein